MSRLIRLTTLMICVLIFPHPLSAKSPSVTLGTLIPVTNTNDSGPGSLRQAILDANAAPGADAISITATGTIVLASALPYITDPLTITGPGATSLIISGNNIYSVLTISSVTVSISGVTIANGADLYGSGVLNFGTLTVSSSTFSGNIAHMDGGGILNFGTLTVSSSTFSGNMAHRNGGGIYNSGTLTVSSSTFSGNLAGSGAGIHNSGTLTVSSSTFSGNLASSGAGISNLNPGTATVSSSTFFANGNSSGILNSGTLNLHNSIIFNSTGDDCYRHSGIVNVIHSLIGDGLDCVNGTNTNNLTGDPGLSADLRPLAGSPVIDAGDNSLIPPGVTTDLAGNARIQGAAVDMGAYESAFSEPPPPDNDDSTDPLPVVNIPPVVVTPPPVPTCEAYNDAPGGVVRASAPDGISYGVNCRVLYQNGRPAVADDGTLYHEGSLGVPGLLNLGVQQAVDIFSPVGMGYFEGGAMFCLRGQGWLIWMAASGMPRRAEIVGSYTVPEFAGFTCVTLFEPGTLALVSRDPLGN